MIDLWGNVDPHIQHSIELLQEHEPPEGYYLAFSGGKDSIVCYDLCKKAGVKFDAHYMRAMEPPEVVYFIRKHYPDVIRHLPKENMWQLIVKHGIYPTRSIPYCCAALKHPKKSDSRIVITGVRRAEGNRRKKRNEYEKFNKSMILTAILYWEDYQVWDYIKSNNLPYPSLYDEGFKRIGCVMCGRTNAKQMQKEAQRWPKIAEAYKRAGVRAFDVHIYPDWKNADDMYNWWISGKSFGKDDGQGELEW
jgi:phosphoadenosine phosphosulfate reductase